jgi:hypothetical protein
MSASDGFTPTQRKILAVLSDFGDHPIEELVACLPDDLGDRNNIHAHLTALRGRLRPRAQDIQSMRLNGRTFYRHVRLTSRDE